MFPIFNRKYTLGYTFSKMVTICALAALLVGVPPLTVLFPISLLTTKEAQAAGRSRHGEQLLIMKAEAPSMPALAHEQNTFEAVAATSNGRILAASGLASISGLVYSDINANGVKDMAEGGVGSVTVTAYDATGVSIADTSTVTATGQYTLSNLPVGTLLRLEYTNLPTGYQPATDGSSTAPGAQFVTTTKGMLSNINFGARVPDNYCQSNPNVCTTVFLTALQNALLTFAYNIPVDAVSATTSHFRLNPVPGVASLPGVATDSETADDQLTRQAGLVQFGDRAWLESDADGLIASGVITPLAALLITATNGTQIYTATTNSQGYYSFTVEAGTYTVTYGSVPNSYGATTASETTGGNQEKGDAGRYQEPGKTEQNHANGTVVTLTEGQANWQIDFVFHAPQSALRLVKQVTPQVAKPGDTLTYSLRLTNNGPDTATGVQVQDLLPATVIYQSSTPEQGTYDESTGSWDVGTLAVDSSVNLTITVTIK